MGYGRGKDAPEEILMNTERAVGELLEKIKEAEESGERVGDLRMCKINSGRFGVEWDRTEKVLGKVGLEEGYRREIEVWDREADFN